MIEFEKFPKLHRLNGPVIVTEKIDGTNGQIVIDYYTEDSLKDDDRNKYRIGISNGLEVFAGSRTRFLTTKQDNFGFANWVYTNVDLLVDTLGVGKHYGEWWGRGIQRGYGLSDKKFSLFNTSRWDNGRSLDNLFGLDVVPVLYEGIFDTEVFSALLELLQANGSCASPGYMNPEGIVIYDTRSGTGFKKTYDYDDTGKGGERDIDDNVV